MVRHYALVLIFLSAPRHSPILATMKKINSPQPITAPKCKVLLFQSDQPVGTAALLSLWNLSLPNRSCCQSWSCAPKSQKKPFLSTATASTVVQLLTQKVLDGCLKVFVLTTIISFLKLLEVGCAWVLVCTFTCITQRWWVLGIYIFTSLQSLYSCLKSIPTESCILWLSTALYSLQSTARLSVFLPL